MQRLALLGAVIEIAVAAIGFAVDGLMAGVAALVGATLASGAQVAAVAMLKPAMQAKSAEFTKAWALGMAVRFGSFLIVAALILTLKDVLPPLWVASGYLASLLLLLFAEYRFLR